jgi:hypothetical protein
MNGWELHPGLLVVSIAHACRGWQQVPDVMSIFAVLGRKWNYSVENPGKGRLVYREGNLEYTFPIYDENGTIVLVAMPSSQRIHFFFNWYGHLKEFSTAERDRILPRIKEHFRFCGSEVRVFSREDGVSGSFEFHPELFEYRDRASGLLEEAGYAWFSDYGAIDLLHEEYGLEITGIQAEKDIKPVLAILQSGFPHWHHHKICPNDFGRESGWTLEISMFASHSCNSESYDESGSA